MTVEYRDSKLNCLLPAPSPSESPQKPKLVLAQNNPHLKSHRRRQSVQVAELDMNVHTTQLSNLPGQYVPGMEHTKQLADVLYQRWSEGLQNRWPAV
jgi:hypothetical protein